MRPKLESTNKGGHVGMTVFGPAEGPLGNIIFTFQGVRNNRSRVVGAQRALFNLTHNGWPDNTTFVLMIHEMGKYMKTHGLTKALLLMDNADVHLQAAALAAMRQYNIRVYTLIPQSTGYTQPLDVCFFGGLQKSVYSRASEDNVILSEDNIAKYVEDAVAEMEKSAAAAGKSILTSAFKKAGVYPLNLDAFTDAHFAPSDARLGLSADHPDVLAAAKETPADHDVDIDHIEAMGTPDVTKKLDNMIARATLAMKFDPTRVLLTDAKVIEALVAKDEAAQAAEEAKVARAAAKAAASAAKKEAEALAKAQRQAEREARRAAKEAAQLQRQKGRKAAAKRGKGPAGNVVPRQAEEADVEAEEQVAPVADDVSRSGRKRKRKEMS